MVRLNMGSRILNLRYIIGLMSVLFISGCAAFNAQDERVTLEAERIGFATEIAALATQDVVERTESAQLAAESDATLAVMNGINQQLVATLQRVITPTPPLDSVQQISGTQAAQFEGRRLFVKTGVSEQVNPQDGCVEGAALTFSVDSPRIYATARAFNIESGTPLMARWFYENELAYEFSFTTERGYDDWCFWFDITPDLVEFKAGSWAVRLYADGFQLEDPIPFTLVETGMTE